MKHFSADAAYDRSRKIMFSWNRHIADVTESLLLYWEYTNILLQCQLFECSCLYSIGSSECDEVEIKKLWLQKFSIFVAIFLHENQDMKILLSDAKKIFFCVRNQILESSHWHNIIYQMNSALLHEKNMKRETIN